MINVPNMNHHQHQYPNHQQQTGQQLLTPHTLYHYTTSNGARGIRRLSMIIPGQRLDQYGPGVYLSSMDPSQYYRREIVDSIHGQRSGRHNSADECVVVYTNQLDPNRLRPVKQDLFVYSGTIPVSPQMVIDKPRCLRPGNQVGGGAQQQWPGSTTYASQQFSTFSPAPAQGYPPPPPPPPQSVPYVPSYNPMSTGQPQQWPAHGAYPYPRHMTPAPPPPPYQVNNNNPGPTIYSTGQQQTTGAPPPRPPMHQQQQQQSMPPYTGSGIPMPQPFPGNGQPIPSQQYTGTGFPQQHRQQQQYTGHQTGYQQSQLSPQYENTSQQQQQQTTGAQSSGFDEQRQPSQQYQNGQATNM